MDFSFDSPSPEETRRAARRLAERLPGTGCCIVLSGALGAGKTVFAKGLGEGLGLDAQAVASPTFVLAHHHPRAAPGRPALVHVDCYRVGSEAELEAAGWLDWLEPGLALVVEWGERFPDALPRERLEIRLERPAGADHGRRLHVRSRGGSLDALARAWQASLGEPSGAVGSGTGCH